MHVVCVLNMLLCGVQIWGASFDMLSLKVATDVGTQLGVVENLENHRSRNNQICFLRVYVALLISKLLWRGGFLVVSDGSRTWATFKYERHLMFCHFCGLLRHDLHHCALYFERKKSGEVGELEYGDWLRANSRCPWSLPQRDTQV